MRKIDAVDLISEFLLSLGYKQEKSANNEFDTPKPLRKAFKILKDSDTYLKIPRAILIRTHNRHIITINIENDNKISASMRSNEVILDLSRPDSLNIIRAWLNF